MSEPAADPPTFDLQAHSVHSDGALEPAEVVARASAAGLRTLSLTDHDTIDGVSEAVAAGAAVGLYVVPGAEISAVDEEGEDLHILGYGFDPADPGLREALVGFRAQRGTRADGMVAALEGLGWHVDRAALDRRRAAGRPIGRPHLAEAVAGHPANAARMAAEGLATPTDLLVAYLVPGTPAYRGRTAPTVAEAVDVIHAAGGLAVWAHPFWDIADADTVLATLRRFVAAGIDGVEVFYATHTEAQVRLLYAACERLGLQTTGSADFHGPGHPLFSRFGAFSLYGLQPRLDRVLAHNGSS